MNKVFYLCDGNVPNCEKNKCYKNCEEEPCRHTTDISHAVNFSKFHKYGNYYERDVEKYSGGEVMT